MDRAVGTGRCSTRPASTTVNVSSSSTGSLACSSRSIKGGRPGISERRYGDAEKGGDGIGFGGDESGGAVTDREQGDGGSDGARALPAARSGHGDPLDRC